jgi:hypothetical protein
MKLGLHANRSAIANDPLRQISQSKPTEHHASEQMRGPIGELSRADRFAHPLVVSVSGEHELELVTAADVHEIVPTVSVALPTSRTFHVHDLVNARVHARNVGFSAGLEKHGTPGVAQLRHEGHCGWLEQGFTARKLHERRLEGKGSIPNRAAAHPDTTVKRVPRIAP